MMFHAQEMLLDAAAADAFHAGFQRVRLPTSPRALFSRIRVTPPMMLISPRDDIFADADAAC